MLPRVGYIAVDEGVRLFFKTTGAGADVVVIPNGLHLVEDFAPLAERRTLFVYDVRNRGLSDTVTDPARLAGGIHNDVDDLDAVRRYLGLEAIDVIGHSYIGLVVALYAMRYPPHARRVVQIGATGPEAGKKYPPDLMCVDAVFADVMSKIAAMQQERGTLAPIDFCRKFWEALRPLYVANPGDANRIQWDRCDLPNELNFMKYWMGPLQASIQALSLTPEMFARVTAEVLTIHGTMDRSAPYGGGKDWAERLPGGRLLTVHRAGHAPWIEAPETVFGAVEAFLGGGHP